MLADTACTASGLIVAPLSGRRRTGRRPRASRSSRRGVVGRRPRHQEWLAQQDQAG
ncbi:MAG TPA: hypothetical protein VIY52_22980 [Streptosporangiaceae bacterium]